MRRAPSPRSDVASVSPHGDVYLRRLRRAQLGLSLLALVAFAGLVGSLPLVLLLAPGIAARELLGVPLSLLLIGVPPYALFVALAWLYERRADGLDEDFRDLMDDGA